jgi:hypothetical protein
MEARNLKSKEYFTRTILASSESHKTLMNTRNTNTFTSSAFQTEPLTPK